MSANSWSEENEKAGGQSVSRRNFVKIAAAGAVAMGAGPGAPAWSAETRQGEMIYRTLGMIETAISDTTDPDAKLKAIEAASKDLAGQCNGLAAGLVPVLLSQLVDGDPDRIS